MNIWQECWFQLARMQRICIHIYIYILYIIYINIYTNNYTYSAPFVEAASINVPPQAMTYLWVKGEQGTTTLRRPWVFNHCGFADLYYIYNIVTYSEFCWRDMHSLYLSIHSSIFKQVPTYANIPYYYPTCCNVRKFDPDVKPSFWS